MTENAASVPSAVRSQRPTAGRGLIVAAALVIVVGGLQLASPIVVPFLIALCLAMILTPAVKRLSDWGLPDSVGVLLVISLFTAVGLLVILLIGASVQGFLQDLPGYTGKLEARRDELLQWLQKSRIHIPKEDSPDALNPRKGLELLRTLIAGLSNLLSQGFLILLTTAFLLFESAVFPRRLAMMLGENHPLTGRLTQILQGVRQYLAIKAWISVLTGLFVTVCLIYFGVTYPLLWGLLTVLLNFVPNIGSLIAAIPPVMLAWLQFDLATAASVAVAYILVNQVMGNVIEPRVMGRGLGLSTVVVFLSLIFWGWVFGLAGMILSVPLTLTIKITLGSLEETRWIAMLLGPLDEVHSLDKTRASTA